MLSNLKPHGCVRARSGASGLMDPICPPSGVFAAFNALTAEKEIAVFPFSEHEIPQVHAERQLADFGVVVG